jgi:probable rRNA maturation factor
MPDPETFEIAVILESEEWLQALPDCAEHTAEVARHALAGACPGIGGEMSILLGDDAALRALNRDWRGIDEPTNVLSFPALEVVAGDLPEPEFPDQPLRLGDIALAWETCHRESAEQGKSLAAHLDHLVIHGVLHLLGHDHVAESDAVVMESLEIRLLAELGIANPYLSHIEDV